MALRQLEEEGWGDKVRRAREAARLTMRAAAEKIGAVHATSHRTLAHIEACRDVPTGSRALTAYIALLAYGFDPDDFGLAGSQAAAVVNREKVIELFSDETMLRDPVKSVSPLYQLRRPEAA